MVNAEQDARDNIEVRRMDAQAHLSASVVVGTTDVRGRRLLARSALALMPPPQPLIQNLIDHPAAVVVVGDYGLGKTATVLGMACCISTGRPWLGHRVERSRVLWVVGESHNALNNRIAAWEQRFNDGAPIPDERFVVMPKPDDLIRDEHWQFVDDVTAQMGGGFVVLDTLSTLFPTADETRDAARIIRRMSDCAHAHNSVLAVVHHTGWGDKSRARGGSQLEANADEVLVLTGEQGSALFYLTSKKRKENVGGQRLLLQRTPFADSIIVEGGLPDDLDLPMQRDIIVALLAVGDIGLTGPQLHAELGNPPRTTFYRNLNRLVDRGAVSKAGNGRLVRYVAATPGEVVATEWD